MTSYLLWLSCAGISVGKEKLKFKSDLTSLDDKLRIANKVNNKYLELGWTDVKDYEGWPWPSGGEKSESLMELVKEAGEEAALILENGINSNSSLSKKKDGNFFNIVVNDDADIATSRPVFFLYYLVFLATLLEQLFTCISNGLIVKRSFLKKDFFKNDLKWREN